MQAALYLLLLVFCDIAFLYCVANLTFLEALVYVRMGRSSHQPTLNIKEDAIVASSGKLSYTKGYILHRGCNNSTPSKKSFSRILSSKV
jgi:hypothetical protein